VGLVDDIRAACGRVAQRARQVRIDERRLDTYAAELDTTGAAAEESQGRTDAGDHETRAAFTVCLDAINFGSGWFPTLRKRGGRSGYNTVALGLRERFAAAAGPPSAAELAWIDPAQVAGWLRQDPGHELMARYATALRELGRRVAAEHGSSFLALARRSTTAVGLVEHMATWPTWHDVSTYDGEPVPFFKRAQILAADLHLGGVTSFGDLARLTLFADNLVPHVLRLDGVLSLDPVLTARIDAGELLEHGSPEEVELRACALHAVEQLAARRPDATPQELDFILWTRGGGPRYKAVPRPRSRTTAY
jgi:Potential Queuosine, Q, salvage protein family